MFTNIFNQTIKADHVVVSLNRGELHNVVVTAIRALTGGFDVETINLDINTLPRSRDIQFFVNGAAESVMETWEKFKEVNITGLEEDDTPYLLNLIFGDGTTARVEDYGDEDDDDLIFIYIPYQTYIRRTFDV